MSANIRKIKYFLQYYFKARSKYKIQSPIAFRICKELMEERKIYYAYEELERLRYQLENNSNIISIVDLGAGSLNSSLQTTRKISDIAKVSLSPQFKCEWLFSLVLMFQPKKIIELGTCLGLGSLYLANANKRTEVITIEGSPALYDLAKANFRGVGAANISAYLGHFDVVLPNVLDANVEMVFIDGNHTKEATLRYYHMVAGANSKQMVIIFDDIYWSQGMVEAWKEIEKIAPYTVDLYHIGIVIFDERILVKQNFTIIPFRYKPWQIGLFG